MSAADKVLVVGPSWVGDMVMAQALYQACLRRRAPAAEIHVVAPPWSLPVLARMPEVARGIELAVGHGELGFGRRRTLGRQLRAERYTRAIVLPRSLKAALVPWFARVPRRTGFRGEWRYGLLERRALARPRGSIKPSSGSSRSAQPRDAEPPESLPRGIAAAARQRSTRTSSGCGDAHRLPGGAPLVALDAGRRVRAGEALAGGAATPRSPRALAQAGANVVVLGSAKERAIGEEVVRPRGERARPQSLRRDDARGRRRSAWRPRRSAVSNDSGLLHVAAAAGAPVVAIYGSSSPSSRRR